MGACIIFLDNKPIEVYIGSFESAHKRMSILMEIKDYIGIWKVESVTLTISPESMSFFKAI